MQRQSVILISSEYPERENRPAQFRAHLPHLRSWSPASWGGDMLLVAVKSIDFTLQLTSEKKTILGLKSSLYPHSYLAIFHAWDPRHWEGDRFYFSFNCPLVTYPTRLESMVEPLFTLEDVMTEKPIAQDIQAVPHPTVIQLSLSQMQPHLPPLLLTSKVTSLYPHNNHMEFTTQLATPLTLNSDWSVRLRKLYLPNKIVYNVQNKKDYWFSLNHSTTVKVKKKTGKIKGGALEDFSPPEELCHVEPGLYPTLQSLLDKLNTASVWLTWAIDTWNDDKVSIEYHICAESQDLHSQSVEAVTQVHIKLSKPLAYMLGYYNREKTASELYSHVDVRLNPKNLPGLQEIRSRNPFSPRSFPIKPNQDRGLPTEFLVLSNICGYSQVGARQLPSLGYFKMKKSHSSSSGEEEAAEAGDPPPYLTFEQDLAAPVVSSSPPLQELKLTLTNLQGECLKAADHPAATVALLEFQYRKS